MRLLPLVYLLLVSREIADKAHSLPPGREPGNEANRMARQLDTDTRLDY